MAGALATKTPLSLTAFLALYIRWSTFLSLSGAFRLCCFSGKSAPSAPCNKERAVAQPKPKPSRGMRIKVQDSGELADEVRGKVEHLERN